MRLINAKRELLRGGVVGMLEAAGCPAGERTSQLARNCGSDLARFWGEVPHAGFMLRMATVLGVDVDVLIHAAKVAVERLMVETGDVGDVPLTRQLVALVDTALGDYDGPQHAERLYEAIREAANALASKEPIGSNLWEGQVLSAASMLAQATWALVCPCGAGHAHELSQSLENCMLVVGVTRITHGTRVGRVPKGTGDEATMTWAHSWTAQAIREVIPVEMLLAPPVMMIPGVTPTGELVFSERGKA